MDRTQALNRIAAAAASGDLNFSARFQAALDFKRSLDDPNCHTAVARLVQAEPLLAARAIATANSAAYNPDGRKVTNIQAAIARVGGNVLRSLTIAHFVRQLAEGLTRPEHRAMADQLWEHTAQVAALAQVIARRVTHLNPATALFAGIVHEVGSFYFLSLAEEYPGFLEAIPEKHEDDESETVVGRAVLEALSVPETVAAALEGFWPGYLALPPQSLGDTLLLADALAPVRSPLHDPRDAGIPTATINVALGEGNLADILRESSEEALSLFSALKF